MSTSPEIVSETISQTAQEGLGVGGEVIAKSEMPGIGHSGETRQPGQEGLRVGQDVRKSTMLEVGQSDVEASQPVVSGSTSEMSLGAASDCNVKSEQMGGVHSEGQSSDAATQNSIRLEKMCTAATILQSVSGKKSVEVELVEASKGSKWFNAIEEKNCKSLLQLFRSDRSLWVQTGLKGRSVLHVAVMQGCSELVRELYHYEGDLVPCGEKWQTPFEFLWENARDGRLRDASAQDIWFVMEGPSFRTRNQNSSEKRELSFDRSRADYIQSHVMCRDSVDSADPEMLSLREAISSIAIKEDFVMDENDVDFNFENVERKELYVHMACSRLQKNYDYEDWKKCCDQMIKFIFAVLTHLSEKNLLQKLFDQKDAQGRTILQIFVLCQIFQHDFACFKMLESAFKRMLEILPDKCVNTLDKAGRTVLHWAVGHDINWAIKELLESRKARTDLTFETAYIRNITAFHLIPLYNHAVYHYASHHPSLKDDLKRDFCVLTTLWNQSYLDIWIGRNPLLWAIGIRRNYFVYRIMEMKEEHKLDLPKQNELLAMAAFTPNVEVLQHFLQKEDVDKLNVVSNSFKQPPLHLAIYMGDAMGFWEDPRTFDNCLHCNDFISIASLDKHLQQQHTEKDSAIVTKTDDVSTRKACANLLLQAGADILAVDWKGRMADPGALAPNEVKIWWYELVAKETLNIKNDLNAAGTGTAVVAALVATASFVGPLQPPLNYVAMSSGTATADVEVQVTELLIKVFVVTNSLSFYLAITSIMLAIMPSLPIPKEGLVFGPCDDLKRSRRTISIAIGMLLASIISVLVSFAASSLVVIPLQHRSLMVYSTSIGGLICCVGSFFFFLRFLRLICRQNTFIRKLYQRIGKL